MAVQIQIRRDVAANWTSANPVLASGEMGLETDTQKYKVGDGATAWNSLSYWTAGDGGNGIAGGTSTAASTGTVVFSNSNGISFGLNGLTMTASHNGLTTGMASDAGSNFMQSGERGNYFYTSNNTFLTTAAQSNHSHGAIQFNLTNLTASYTSASNGLTVDMSAGAGGAGDGGNIIAAAGSTAASTGTIVFSNANGVSFGLNGGTMTASVAAAGGAQTGISGVIAGSQTQTVGTMEFVNSNGITFGMSNSSQITASYTVPTQTQQPMAYSGANGSTTANTLVFANSNGVSFSTGTQGLYATVKTDYQTSGAYLTTAMASDAGSNFAGLNGAMTGGSMTLNSLGVSIQLENNAAYLYGNTYGTSTITNAPGDQVYVGVGGISLGKYSAGNRLEISYPESTSFRMSNDGIGLNTAITQNGVSMTANSSGLSLNFPAFLTTAMQSDASSAFAGTGTSITGNMSITLNTAGIAVSQGNVSMYALGNTTGSLSSGAINLDVMRLSAEGMLSVGVDTSPSNHYVISAPAASVFVGSANTTNFAGVGSAITNGTMTFGTGGLSLNLSNHLTTAAQVSHSHGNPTLALTNLSGTTASASNGLTISLSAAAAGAGGGIALGAGGNTATSGTVIFGSSAGNVTFGMATDGYVTASAPTGGGAALTLTNWRVQPMMNNTSFYAAMGQNSQYNQHFMPEDYLAFNNIEMYIRGTYVSSTNSQVYANTIKYGIYSQDTGTNNTRMTLMASSSALMKFSFASNTGVGYTFSQGAASFTTSSGGTAMMTDLSSPNHLYLPFVTTLNPNVKHAFALLMSTATTVGTSPWAFQPLIQSNMNSRAFGKLFASTYDRAASTVIGDREMGIYNTTTNALVGSYATSQMSVAVSRMILPIQFE